MKLVVDLVQEIRNRPGMYIGQRSAIGLHLFLQGWLLGKESVEDSFLLREFSDWISTKYGVTSSHSWADIISFYSEGPVEAFEKFFPLFDQFLEQRK